MDRRILLIEDDSDLAGLACMHLEDHGFEVATRANGDEGLEAALADDFDLLLVDIMLPGVDGLEICRQVRNRKPYVPLVILTARGEEVDRVLGLELGADDYLTKPVSFRELVARVKAIFRRVDALQPAHEPGGEGAAIRRGPISIDTRSHAVRVHGQRLDLTAKEYELLLHFVQNPGQVFTRTQLVDSLWGPGFDGYEHTVNSHINRLRSKINRGGARERFIETVWGVGYRLGDDIEGPAPDA